MDAATRGQTIQRTRKRRGLSQAALAGLVGRSESWLSQVERGKRKVDSYDVPTRLAEVLRVDIHELTVDETSSRIGPCFTATDAIETAMMRYTSQGIIQDSGGEQVIDAERLRKEADRTYAAYQATRYDEVAGVYPG